jgi:hypothetical protein
VIGDTSPTLPAAPPPPRKKKCGGLAIIVVAVVAVVATVLTAGALAPVAGQSMWAAGTAALGFGAAGAAGASIGAALVGGAMGSIAGQLTGMALGVQDKFSWGAVAAGALGAGIGASGVGQAITGSIGSAVGLKAGELGMQILGGAVSNVMSQGASLLTGQQKGFSWAGVAAGAIAAPVVNSINDKLFGSVGANGLRTGAFAAANPTAAILAESTASALVSATTRLVVQGGQLNWDAVAADALSSFVQSRISANGAITQGNQLEAEAAAASNLGLTDDSWMSGHGLIDFSRGVNVADGATRSDVGQTPTEQAMLRVNQRDRLRVGQEDYDAWSGQEALRMTEEAFARDSSVDREALYKQNLDYLDRIHASAQAVDSAPQEESGFSRSIKVGADYFSGIGDVVVDTARTALQGWQGILDDPLEAGKALLWYGGDKARQSFSGLQMIANDPGQALKAGIWALGQARDYVSDQLSGPNGGRFVGTMVGSTLLPSAASKLGGKMRALDADVEIPAAGKGTRFLDDVSTTHQSHENVVIGALRSSLNEDFASKVYLRVELPDGRAVTVIPDGLARSGNSYVIHEAKFSQAKDLLNLPIARLRNTFTRNQKLAFDAIAEGKAKVTLRNSNAGRQLLGRDFRVDMPIQVQPKINVYVNTPSGVVKRTWP